MQPPLRLIVTQDGSHSLLREDLNETYHSFHGAWSESTYVFVEQGLAHFHSLTGKTALAILEVGFGTGLNALLAWQYAQTHHLNLHFQTLEPWPVPPALYAQLNYGEHAQHREMLRQLHEADWKTTEHMDGQFTLTKHPLPLEQFETADRFELIFFDAFAPSKQAEVWSLDNLRKCFELLKLGGMLTTYCAQGQFKRNLASVGFQVEILRGALGKKEMVRAVKVG